MAPEMAQLLLLIDIEQQMLLLQMLKRGFVVVLQLSGCNRTLRSERTNHSPRRPRHTRRRDA